jgi:hypothetical protein
LFNSATAPAMPMNDLRLSSAPYAAATLLLVLPLLLCFGIFAGLTQVTDGAEAEHAQR